MSCQPILKNEKAPASGLFQNAWRAVTVEQALETRMNADSISTTSAFMPLNVPLKKIPYVTPLLRIFFVEAARHPPEWQDAVVVK